MDATTVPDACLAAGQGSRASADEGLEAIASLAQGAGAFNLGVFGGTFDPIHQGHLACAEMARDACGLDRVLFVVAPRPWMKQQQRLADAGMRLEMCRLAVAGNPAFEASSLELERPGVTYTSDTLRILRGALPGSVRLFFVIGADSLETLPGWRDADALASLATFVCVTRPGRPDDERLLERARARGFRVEWVDAPLLDISSSEVRRRVSEGKSVRYLVPDAVLDRIEEDGLYAGGEDG